MARPARTCVAALHYSACLRMMLPDILLQWLQLRSSLPMLHVLGRTVRMRFGFMRSACAEDAHVARNDALKCAIRHGRCVTLYMRSATIFFRKEMIFSERTFFNKP